MDIANEPLFTAFSISKSFPGVQALKEVNFDLIQGEVHALVGENGAGKSTFARIIAGAEIPDSGEMRFCGKPYRPNNRTDAESAGIRMIMQELHLIGNLTIAENILLNKLPHRLGIIDYKKLNSIAREVMAQVGLGDTDPDMPVKFLGTGRQQLVEIAAGLSQRCRLLIMDEPTASLTDNETELLFTQIKKLKADGVGIIYISHRIEEIIRVTDRVTVLRDGKLISTQYTKRLSVDGIIRMMVGRDLEQQQLRHAATSGETALSVTGLTRANKVKDVTFDVHKGEILGVAGLMGSGRTEMVRALFGMTWRVLVSAGPQYFVTTDNPAFFFRAYGLAREESELTFPLSTTHALHGSWRAAGSDLVFLRATQRIVKEINRRLASDTERLAFYHEAAPWLLAIFSKKHPYLSIIRWLHEPPNHCFQWPALTSRR